MNTCDERLTANTSALTPEQFRVVRLGHGANCSSVGSVVDTLFVSATVGGAVLVAICAAMKREPVTVLRRRPATDAANATNATVEREANDKREAT